MHSLFYVTHEVNMYIMRRLNFNIRRVKHTNSMRRKYRAHVRHNIESQFQKRLWTQEVALHNDADLCRLNIHSVTSISTTFKLVLKLSLIIMSLLLRVSEWCSGVARLNVLSLSTSTITYRETLNRNSEIREERRAFVKYCGMYKVV